MKAKFSNNWKILLKADKRQKPCCPSCDSGTGKDKTSAADFVKGGFELNCQKCGFTGDVFKIYALQNCLDGQRDFPAIVKAVAEALNFTEGEEFDRRAIAISKADDNDKQAKENLIKAYQQLKEQLPSDKIRRYLKGRGFNDSIIEKFAREITSEIKSEFPELIKAPIGSLVILYSDAEYFISRVFNIDNKSVKGYFKLPNITQPIFFSSAFNKTTEETIFITEGELDALSIFQAGGFAASVGGGGGEYKLLEFLEKERSQGKRWKLVLALDSDEAGKEHSNKLAAKLKSLSFTFSTLEMAAKCKDPNEWLQISPETLKKAVLEAKQWAASDSSDSTYKEGEDLAQDSLLKYSAANALKQFEKNIDSGRYKPTATGLKAFDDMLGGGLYPGLYVIAAATGFGKSTFCLQVADELATRGNDVVYFSLEMSQDELIARSLSRLSYLKARDKKFARTTRAILQRSTIPIVNRGFLDEYNQVYSDALDAFERMADKLFYRDGSSDRITIGEVENFVRQLVESGRRPFVFVDYLQFLKTDIQNLTDKQQADRVIEALKRLSTRYGITVVAISSINRQSYSSKAGLSALKESGQIEFTGDAVLMIQPSEVSDENAKDKYEEVLSQEERDLEVVLLKNRYGALGKAYFKFFAKFNLFAEAKSRKSYG